MGKRKVAEAENAPPKITFNPYIFICFFSFSFIYLTSLFWFLFLISPLFLLNLALRNLGEGQRTLGGFTWFMLPPLMPLHFFVFYILCILMYLIFYFIYFCSPWLVQTFSWFWKLKMHLLLYICSLTPYFLELTPKFLKFANWPQNFHNCKLAHDSP